MVENIYGLSTSIQSKSQLSFRVSYGYSAEGYDPCPGYWDEELQWREGKFDQEGWMVEALVKSLHEDY